MTRGPVSNRASSSVFPWHNRAFQYRLCTFSALSGFCGQNLDYIPATSNADSKRRATPRKRVMTISIAKQPKFGSADDEQFGYPFGVDGTVPPAKACELLASISRRTLDRLVQRRKIRAGLPGGRLGICTRSVMEYLRSTEK